MKKLFIIILGTLYYVTAVAQTKGTLPIKEGEEGIYLFLAPQRFTADNNSIPFTEAVVYRANGTGNNYTEIGRLKAAQSAVEFKKIVGEEALLPVMKYKKLATEEEAWNYILRHPKLDEYGLLSMDIKFLEAMGICFVDRDISSFKKGSQVRYQVKFTSREGKTGTTDGSVLLGTIPAIQKPVQQYIKEQDSVLIISWKAIARMNTDAVYAKVYRKTGNYGRYEQVGNTIANSDTANNAVSYTWREPVATQKQYNYYIVPCTITGLNGPASDTIAAISNDFTQLPQGNIMAATDTLNGILLSWQLPATSPFEAGIIVERSKDPAKGFAVLDTIAAGSTFYIDKNVLPNLMYHYRIRAVSIRQNSLDVSAQASAMHTDTHLLLEAPEQLQAKAGKNYITLNWQKSAYPEVAGYYLYRFSEADKEWELVSNLVKDTVFTDSSAINGRRQYKYAVAAVNYAGQQSALSNNAFAMPDAIVLPAMPLGLQAANDGSRNLVNWKDMRVNDELITGYNVYRRTTISQEQTSNELTQEELKRKGFTKINTTPVKEVVYTDGTATGTVEYAVTAVDLLGRESNATGAVILATQNYLMRPPANISARATSKGIEISWDASAQNGVDAYVIMKRKASEATAVQAGRVPAGQTSFVDTNLRKGELYFYSVKTTGNNTTSEASIEKGVRH